MSDIPIIFSAPMVRALLDGRKTMTRRLAWRETLAISDDACFPDGRHKGWRSDGDGFYTRPSPWQKARSGDRLWVRENLRKSQAGWCWAAGEGDGRLIEMPRTDARVPAMIAWAHHKEQAHCPSIHMPRWASRLTLTVTGMKIERLQNISETDARAEGCSGRLGPNPDFPDEWDPSPQEEFRDLWKQLHGPGAWDANPEVVAITFRIEKANIDSLDREAA